MKWYVEWDNDTGPDDDYYVEWWSATDGEKNFRANSKEDAEWLAGVLNRKISGGKKP